MRQLGANGMTFLISIWFLNVVSIAQLSMAAIPSASKASNTQEEVLITENQPGVYGGHLVVSLRSEPKTLNPVIANDISSREVTEQMTADLIHINRNTQQCESALAKSWEVSTDKLRYTLELRQGLRFSDGVPLDADDVIFTFKVYLDERVNAPQRDSLLVGGKPITVRKVNSNTVIFTLARPYASAERLFDSLAILPRHLLEQPYLDGKLVQAWSLDTQPVRIAGLGPFRLKEYVPGQRLTLERNPYYWKKDSKGNRLPYLSEITFVFVGNEDAEILRFEAGETDATNRINAENFSLLQKVQASHGLQLYDLGPSLEYNFLLFNLNSKLPVQAADISHKQQWFNNAKFRQAISSAIDRDGVNRLVYLGHGAPIWTHVTPGNRLWFDPALSRPGRSLRRSRELLEAGGFSWRGDGTLIDRQGTPIEFSIIASASSRERTEMATIIQQDLQELGIRVQVVPLEFRSMLDRIFQTHNYEAAVMGLGGGDIDPNSQMNVWLSSGDDHLWNLGQTQPATEWEAEIDRLMRQQMSTTVQRDRKRLYDQVQEIEQENVPVVFIVSPNLLVGAKNQLRNFKPAILDPHTLWNSEQLYFQDQRGAIR
jgi:peptide/nickel transport system substrate-binding protein